MQTTKFTGQLCPPTLTYDAATPAEWVSVHIRIRIRIGIRILIRLRCLIRPSVEKSSRVESCQRVK